MAFFVIGSGFPPPKKRRVEVPAPPPPTTIALRPLLGKRLYAQVKETLGGGDLDLTLFVGPLTGQRLELKAHKCVLLASSPVLLKQVEEDPEASAKGARIHVPPEFTVGVVKAFIKAVYLEKIDKEETSIYILLDLLWLCDLWEVKKLVAKLVDILKEKASSSNANQIWKFAETRLIHMEGDCEVASKIMKFCIEQMAKDLDSCIKYPFWCKQQWVQLLKDDDDQLELPKDLTEINLFQALVKWGKKFPDRNLKKLISLIRFPLIELHELMEIVSPTGLLSQSEILELVSYHSLAEVTSYTKFNTKPRSNRRKIAIDSDQFQELINEAKPGDWIQLDEGEFKGPFFVKTDRLYIEGKGRDSVIWQDSFIPEEASNPLSIKAKYVTISNLAFFADEDFYCPCMECDDQYSDNESFCCNANGTLSAQVEVDGSNCTLSNIIFKNCSMVLNGNCNRLVDSHFSLTTSRDRMPYYVKSEGKLNSIKNTNFTSSQVGIIVIGDENRVEDIQTKDVILGVQFLGNKNKLVGLQHTCLKDMHNGSSNPAALSISGCENEALDVKCLEYEARPRLYFYSVFFLGDPKRNNVTNAGPGCVKLAGRSNSLKNVDCGKGSTISIDGSDHTLSNCKAKKCSVKGSSSIDINNCDFGLM